MKEFLNPLNGGGYELGETPLSYHSIEVPEGAGIFAIAGVNRWFYKTTNGVISHWWHPAVKMWLKCGRLAETLDILWQRPTQPEALPFIDDEPPAYYGNAIRLKPRRRVYAVMGGEA